MGHFTIFTNHEEIVAVILYAPDNCKNPTATAAIATLDRMQGVRIGRVDAVQDRFTIGDLTWMLHESPKASHAPLPLTDKPYERAMTRTWTG